MQCLAHGILDGSSEYDTQVRRKRGISTCLRHLFTLKAVSNLKYVFKKDLFPLWATFSKLPSTFCKYQGLALEMATGRHRKGSIRDPWGKISFDLSYFCSLKHVYWTKLFFNALHFQSRVRIRIRFFQRVVSGSGITRESDSVKVKNPGSGIGAIDRESHPLLHLKGKCIKKRCLRNRALIFINT